MNEMNQAPKGGQIGMNGERYEGGQFLPNTRMGKLTKAEQRALAKAATRTHEIAPYTWEVAPAAGLKSIYRQVVGTYAQLNRSTGMLEPYEPYFEFCVSAFAGFDRQTHIDLIDRWNAGERWM